MSRIMVLGAGGWGIGLALVAARMEHAVTLWSFDPKELDELRLHNQNRLRLPGVFLPHSVRLTGDLSDEVVGCGFDFLQNDPLVMEPPTVIEDKERIPVELDKEKTDLIIKTINNWNM